jgi:hydroxyacylglutathione hydrolase
MHPARLVPVPALADNYIWLVADAGGAAVVVDPGEAAPVGRVLQRDGLVLKAILLTHHHGDHIGGAAELAAASGAPVYAPRDPRIGLDAHRVGDGERVVLEAPALDLEVLEVPGHTATHIAFFGNGLLFSGDTLFSVGCGRLFEGTPAQMLASLDRLAALPGATLLCCGHEYTLANCAFALGQEPGNATLAARAEEAARQRAAGQPTLPVTLDLECATNPFLRIDAPELAAALGGGDRVARFAELRRRKDEFRMPAR